jgi:hypothetical protein
MIRENLEQKRLAERDGYRQMGGKPQMFENHKL